MGWGEIQLLPNMPRIPINITEATWSVEGREPLLTAVHFGNRIVPFAVPVMPVLQRHLLIIGDKDGNPVSEHHDKPIEKIEETS